MHTVLIYIYCDNNLFPWLIDEFIHAIILNEKWDWETVLDYIQKIAIYAKTRTDYEIGKYVEAIRL